MKIARFLAACFGALFLAVLGAQPAFAAGNPLTLSTPTFTAASTNYGQQLNGGYGATGASVNLTPPFTIEARLSGSPSGTQVAIGNSNAFGWFGLNGGQFGGYIGASGGTALAIFSNSIAPDGGTHEVAVVVPDYNAANIRFYVDGVSYAGATSGSGNVVFTVAPFGIRANPDGSYAFGGGVDEVRISNVARYTANYTPTTSPFASDGSTVDLYHLDGDGSDTVSALTIAPNDPAIVYSPANWNVTSASATTINGGAYGRVVISDPSPVLNFDVSKMVTSAKSQIACRMDGGSWIVADIASTLPCAASSDTSGEAKHLLEWAVKATTEFQVPSQSGQRWDPSTGPNTAVVFTGLTLATGSTVSAPKKATLTGAMFGDSITEGYLTLNGSAATDALRSDSMRGWAFELRRQLGAEIGVIGFGGQGWDGGGVGSIPSFPNTYASLYSGATRSFAGLDFVAINMGTNGTTTVTNVTAVLNGILAAAPASCQIFVMRPFNGAAAANLQAGIAASTNPARIAYLDTTGADVTGVDGTHPSASANLITNAPLVAAALRAAGLGGLSTKPPFRLGFH